MRKPMNDKTVLVVGGGRYGTRAARFFREQMARVIVVDSNPECPAREFVCKEDFLIRDAKDVLEFVLKVKPDLIVPTVPGHTIGKWLAEYFRLAPLPDRLPYITKRLPESLIVTFDEKDAVLISSYMGHGKICRDDCLPSPEHCALTGEPRPAPLYRLLDYAIYDAVDCGKIFTAEQLAAGIGAVRTVEFLEFFKQVKRKKPETLAVGTACQCHGILSLFQARRVCCRNGDASPACADQRDSRRISGKTRKNVILSRPLAAKPGRSDARVGQGISFRDLGKSP